MISPPWEHQFPRHLSLFTSPKGLVLGGLNLLALLLIVIGGIGGWQQLQHYENRFLPGTTLDGYDLTGLSFDEAAASYNKKSRLNQSFELKITSEEHAIASTSSDLEITKNVTTTLAELQHQTTTLPWIRRLFAALEIAPLHLSSTSRWIWNQEKLQAMIDVVRTKIEQPAVEPTISLSSSNNAQTLSVTPGKLGKRIDQEVLFNQLSTALDTYQPDLSTPLTLTVPFQETGTQLGEDQLSQLREQASNLVGKHITLTAPSFQKTWNDQALITFLGDQYQANTEQVQQRLDELETQLNRPAQDAVFEYNPDNLHVTAFQPDLPGLTLEKTALHIRLPELLKQAGSNPEPTTFELPVTVTTPRKTLAETNNLGIRERIGFGDSEYDHSIPSRIHNVSLTSQKMNWIIVKPGEEFSFNRALGEVSARTGFKPAYVIKGGQTVLGDGGGVCQVSTTLFRALLDGGINITKRRPHSYRVSYYELNRQAGFDATVYSGDVDLRFINDTPGHILINTEAKSDELYMQVALYGTSDGRTSEITEYKSWDFRPAPAPLYFPDPTLAPGQKVQIDWATSGIKTSFTHTVKDRHGTVLREVIYTSNYIPWSAKYRQGV